MPSQKVDDTDIFGINIVMEKGTVRLDNKDIIDCYFIEDIYSFGITGKLIFNDLYGMVEQGPFTGNETIYIIYGNDEKLTMKFNIYKVNKISQISNIEPASQNAVELIFTDTMFLNLTKNRYSISWTDTKISDIIRYISKNMLDTITFDKFEETNETLPYFYMPYWTPLEAINWLLKRGSGATSGKAGYMYYNNSKGTNYVTLEQLMANTESKQSNESIYDEYVFESINPGFINKILGWKILGIDNTGMTSIKGGHVLGYDFETKSLYNQSHEYLTSISKYTMLGRKTLFKDISNDTMMYMLEGDNDTAILDNIYQHNFIRKYNIQQCFSITVRGSEKRYPGDMIKIRWPSTMVKEEKANRNLEGRFLIKAITHSLNPYKNPPYRQKLTLIKNAYSDSYYTGLIPATKTNVGVRL